MAIRKYKEDFILLAEAGFIAVNQGDEDASVKLFKAAELLDSKNVLPKLGFGYIHLHKLELKQAVEWFEKVLKIDPKNEMAQAFMGLSISLMPDKADQGEKVLKGCLHSHDPLVKKMATDAVGFIHQFVKQPPGPAGKNK